MKITFSSTHNAWSVKAPKGTLISLTEEPTVIKDGVYVVGDDGTYTIDDGVLTDSIYLSTEGNNYTAERGARVCYPAEGIEVRAGSSVLPYIGKAKSSGGGSGGATSTLLYQTTAASAADIPLADIELSHPYTDYDVLVFLIVTRYTVEIIRTQMVYNVNLIGDKNAEIILGDFAAPNQYLYYMLEYESPTLLKYSNNAGNYHRVYAVYGIKFSGSGGSER